MAFTRIPGPTFILKQFTTSGTWVCPAGVYTAEFLVVGAGGAGGGADNSVNTRASAGGGGGGGAVKRQQLVTTPGSTYTITIGAKGTGAVALAGTNGGFSEIVLSGTTLIRSFGGGGGNGITAADASDLPTRTKTLAGSGGTSQSLATVTNFIQAGGGGGALFTERFNPTTTSGANTYSNYIGVEGGLGGATNFPTQGRMGIDGLGAGGGGGVARLTALDGNEGAAPYGAGNGGSASSIATATDVAGTAALANTGAGGGGALSAYSTTGAAGGNGSDGIVRISYYA
jgi:hypothetical protein